MNRSVDYYFAPQSPWTYLGHQRFCDIARAQGATVRVLPIDLGGKVFPISDPDHSSCNHCAFIKFICANYFFFFAFRY